MIPVVEKAVKILMKEEPEGFVNGMNLIKKNISEKEWEELSKLTLFEILQNVTVADAILAAENG